MAEKSRPEAMFYNSYGNYTHLRFQDFSGWCEHRSDKDRNCAHPDNELGPDAECLCDYCPLVEAATQSDDPTEPEFDPTDWSEGEQPILIMDDALRARLFGASSSGNAGVRADAKTVDGKE